MSHETRTLEYPSGSILIRAARKKQEIWVYDNRSLSQTIFFMDISSCEGVVLNRDEDITELEIGMILTLLFP